jgi:hypothetical protein
MDLGDRLGTPRFLIHDRDPVFTTAFGEVFKAEGCGLSPPCRRRRGLNAICERVNGALCRELLHRILIVGERHLALVLREYVAHYTATGRTSPGGSGPRIRRRSLSGTWPTCDRSAENASPRG